MVVAEKMLVMVLQMQLFKRATKLLCVARGHQAQLLLMLHSAMLVRAHPLLVGLVLSNFAASYSKQGELVLTNASH